MHDHLGRLVGASASSLGAYSATYGYDAFSNNTASSVSGATPPQAIGFTFGALPLNQTPSLTLGGSSTGWAYDPAGEATQFGAAVGSSSVTGLQWDGLGRMSQVNASGLTENEGYAPSGMRVRRDDSVAANSRRFVYTSGGLLLGEYTPAVGGGWQWKRDVVYLGSQAIAEIDANGTHELHSDHLGTPRVSTTASGGTSVIEGRQNYGPYGETFPAMDSGYQPLTGYTGHVQTDPTGLIYMRGRFYSPIWHRFVNSDQGADPSTFNQMAYVAGSPMMATDPSGMMLVECRDGVLYEDGEEVTVGGSPVTCSGGGSGGGPVIINWPTGGPSTDVTGSNGNYSPDFSWTIEGYSGLGTSSVIGTLGGGNPQSPKKPCPPSSSNIKFPPTPTSADYATVSESYGIGVGYTRSYTTDKFGNRYITNGVSIGKSLFFYGIQKSWGWYDKPSFLGPVTEGDLVNLLSGWGGNQGGNFLVGYNSSSSTSAPFTSNEVSIGIPSVGVQGGHTTVYAKEGDCP